MTDIHYLPNKEGKKLFLFNVDSSKTLRLSLTTILLMCETLFANMDGGDRKYDIR